MDILSGVAARSSRPAGRKEIVGDGAADATRGGISTTSPRQRQLFAAQPSNNSRSMPISPKFVDDEGKALPLGTAP